MRWATCSTGLNKILACCSGKYGALRIVPVLELMMPNLHWMKILCALTDQSWRSWCRALAKASITLACPISGNLTCPDLVTDTVAKLSYNASPGSHSMLSLPGWLRSGRKYHHSSRRGRHYCSSWVNFIGYSLKAHSQYQPGRINDNKNESHMWN